MCTLFNSWHCVPKYIMKYIYGDFTASKLLSKSCVFCVYNDARLFWALMNFLGHWTVPKLYYINLITVFQIYRIYKQQAIITYVKRKRISYLQYGLMWICLANSNFAMNLRNIYLTFDEQGNKLQCVHKQKLELGRNK